MANYPSQPNPAAASLCNSPARNDFHVKRFFFVGWVWVFLFSPFFVIFKKDFIYSFIERGREGKGEKHQCVVASCVPRTGDLARSPGTCPDWESYWRPFGSQAGTQSTELNQPGLLIFFNPHQRTCLLISERRKRSQRESSV